VTGSSLAPRRRDRRSTVRPPSHGDRRIPSSKAKRSSSEKKPPPVPPTPPLDAGAIMDRMSNFAIQLAIKTADA